MLDVCLLGTGGMMPLPYRWLTSLMTRCEGSHLLIDCGEGTQIALKKKGWSLRALSVEAGLGPDTLRVALQSPYLKAEKIIAAAIGVKPEEIWPERYAQRNLKPKFPKMGG